jgi:hypothetical protein
MSPKTLILAYFILIQYVLRQHFIAFGLVLQFSASRHTILQEVVQSTQNPTSPSHRSRSMEREELIQTNLNHQRGKRQT